LDRGISNVCDDRFGVAGKMSKRLLFVACLGCMAMRLAMASDPEVMTVSIDDMVSGKATLPDSGAVSTAQPNAAALRVAADSGYVAVIDLRGSNEDRGIDEKAEVEALGMTYLSLPIVGEAAISFENASELDRLMADIDGPVLLHCGSGNRVGALFALREKLHGASDEAALEKGRAAGLTSLEGVVRQRLAESP
jgi:uncharacterized protein (TIGR01244 family)